MLVHKLTYHTYIHITSYTYTYTLTYLCHYAHTHVNVLFVGFFVPTKKFKPSGMKLTWCWATKPHRSSTTTFVVCGRKVVNFINKHRGNPKMTKVESNHKIKESQTLQKSVETLHRPVTYKVSCITIHPKPLTSHTHPLSSPFRFHCWSE